MSMLEQIVAYKREELARTKQLEPLEELEKQLPVESPVPFARALTKPELNIIAEIKYQSPSHGPFSCQLPAVDLAGAYARNGAAAISVVTEQRFFSGDLASLNEIHQEYPQLPLLRKDFIVDRYQVLEGKIQGASAYLLIVASLNDGELRSLISYGTDLQLDPLVEVHDLRELERAVEGGARIIGVNNRDLKSFRVDLGTSFEIAKQMEGVTGHVLVSESGICEMSQIQELRDAGFSAFLVGSVFMDSDDPGAKLKQLRGEA